MTTDKKASSGSVTPKRNNKSPKAGQKKKLASILKTQPTSTQLQNGMDEIPSTSQLNQIFSFPPPFQSYDADATAYQARVDLSGFANENISLDLDGRRLIVRFF